jgi:pimeloyl-ACP methyl ester carboxylesterase
MLNRGVFRRPDRVTAESPPDWFVRNLACRADEGRVPVEGAQLETLVWGERGRPGVLLMHGIGGHAGWWRPLAPFLAEGRRVAAFSLSGMGGSDRREAYSFSQYAREAVAVAEAAGLNDAGRPPVFIGHSFGSVAMLLAAARRPEAMAAAVAVETTLLPHMKVREPKEAAPAQRTYASRDEARARFRLIPPAVAAPDYLLDVVFEGALGAAPAAGGGWTWRQDPEFGRRMARESVGDETAGIATPSTFLWGSDSVTSTPEARAWLARRLPPQARHAVIPGAGHHVMLDQPLALAAALRALLAVLDPA